MNFAARSSFGAASLSKNFRAGYEPGPVRVTASEAHQKRASSIPTVAVKKSLFLDFRRNPGRVGASGITPQPDFPGECCNISSIYSG